MITEVVVVDGKMTDATAEDETTTVTDGTMKGIEIGENVTVTGVDVKSALHAENTSSNVRAPRVDHAVLDPPRTIPDLAAVQNLSIRHNPISMHQAYLLLRPTL